MKILRKWFKGTLNNPLSMCDEEVPGRIQGSHGLEAGLDTKGSWGNQREKASSVITRMHGLVAKRIEPQKGTKGNLLPSLSSFCK